MFGPDPLQGLASQQGLAFWLEKGRGTLWASGMLFVQADEPLGCIWILKPLGLLDPHVAAMRCSSTKRVVATISVRHNTHQNPLVNRPRGPIGRADGHRLGIGPSRFDHDRGAADVFPELYLDTKANQPVWLFPVHVEEVASLGPKATL